MTVDKPHATKNTGNMEWYTPAPIIEAARRVMGGIDLDPASSELANTVVKAATFYTQEENGLAHIWTGRVFLNPPYKRQLIEAFCNKLLAGWVLGEIEQAVVLVNNATETQWFGDMAKEAVAIVFLSKRVRYWNADGPGAHPLQGQAVLYFGKATFAFLREFSSFGWGIYL